MPLSLVWRVLPVVRKSDSRALPGYAYGDPARIVEFQELRTMGCSVYVNAQLIFGRALCSKGLKLPDCRKDKRNGYRLMPEAGG